MSPSPTDDLLASSAFDFSNHSHRRYSPLTDAYILCSPHRSKRPWQGAREESKGTELPQYDPRCYLCPGNIRATGDINPKYTATYTFLNDYPAVRAEQPEYKQDDSSLLKNQLLKAEGVRGKCYVICFSPNHQLTLPRIPVCDIIHIIESWTCLFKEFRDSSLKKLAPYKYLQIFENKGSSMGCSNPHPHGQAWCLDVIPTEVSHELFNMQKYHAQHESHLLGDYVKLELQEKERIVCNNDSFLVVVPYWALWPFETLVISKEHLTSLMDFNNKHKQDLASILKELTTRYDNLFSTLFPYSMGIHQAPLVCSEKESNISWFHMHFYPPLLRLSTIKKFCVGFEMLGEAQRDITSEQAAVRLQDVSGDLHYLAEK